MALSYIFKAIQHCVINKKVLFFCLHHVSAISLQIPYNIFDFTNINSLSTPPWQAIKRIRIALYCPVNRDKCSGPIYSCRRVNNNLSRRKVVQPLLRTDFICSLANFLQCLWRVWYTMIWPVNILKLHSTDNWTGDFQFWKCAFSWMFANILKTID